MTVRAQPISGPRPDDYLCKLTVYIGSYPDGYLGTTYSGFYPDDYPSGSLLKDGDSLTITA